jgi:hypothetical protein
MSPTVVVLEHSAGMKDDCCVLLSFALGQNTTHLSVQMGGDVLNPHVVDPR